MTWEMWKRRLGEILIKFSTKTRKLINDLQKSDCYGLNSERKKILTSSQPPLACVVLLLPVFRTLLVHFFRLQHKIDSPKFFHPQGDRHISPFS